MDPYAVLGVAADASGEEIATAHRQAVKRAHPDAGGDPETFLHVQQAFELLSDPVSRSRYDTERALVNFRASYAGPGPASWPRVTPGPGAVPGEMWPPQSYVWMTQGPVFRVVRPSSRPPARSKPSTPWTIMIGSLMVLSLLSESSGVDLLWIALLVIPLVLLYQAKRFLPRGLAAKRGARSFGPAGPATRPPKRRTSARPKASRHS